MDFLKVPKPGITYIYIRKSDAAYEIRGQTVVFAFSVLTELKKLSYFAILKTFKSLLFSNESAQILNTERLVA